MCSMGFRHRSGIKWKTISLLIRQICLQELTYCGPKNEVCVQNQTLRNQKCLVPCEGLYADIADDSLNQKLDDVYAVVQQKIGGSILNQFFSSN